MSIDIFSPVVGTDVVMRKSELVLRHRNEDAEKVDSNDLMMICLGYGIHSSTAVALLKSVSASSTS
jgi:hypothetical protein